MREKCNFNTDHKSFILLPQQYNQIKSLIQFYFYHFYSFITLFFFSFSNFLKKMFTLQKIICGKNSRSGK